MRDRGRVLPTLRILVPLEGLPMFFMDNIKNEQDAIRLGAWMDSNQETRELTEWALRWADEGRLNAPAPRVDVADPFAVSGGQS